MTLVIYDYVFLLHYHTPMTLFSYMVVFLSIFSICHGPLLSYLHGNKLRKWEEIGTGINNEESRFE